MKTLGTVVVLAVLSMGGLVSPASADVTINIGPPPPPIIVASPPKVVVVPGTPVYYAPAASHDLFVYGGSYYALHNGHWFYARKPGAAWVLLPVERVPRPIIGVPVTYYKIKPGHHHHHGRGHHHGHGHGKDWKKDKRD